MYTVKAKRKDNGTWVRGYLWLGANNAYVIPDNLGIDFENNNLKACAYEVERDTICRSSNVDAYWIDKNGAHLVNIYENDIVEVAYNDETYVGPVVYDLGTYIIKIPELPEEFLTFIDRQHGSGKSIDVRIVGNVYDIATNPKNKPVEADKNNADTSEACPYFERRETSYDVLSGHSDYQDYCTKDYDRRIIKCVHCTLCKQKEKNS